MPYTLLAIFIQRFIKAKLFLFVFCWNFNTLFLKGFWQRTIIKKVYIASLCWRLLYLKHSSIDVLCSITASSQSVSGASRKRKAQSDDQQYGCPPTKRYHQQTRSPGYTHYPPVDRYHWTPAASGQSTSRGQSTSSGQSTFRGQSISTYRPLPQQTRVYVNPHHAAYNYMVAGKRE